jgi:ribosome recycling factor
MNIEKAIRDVPNLGAQPNNDGTVIRVTLPDLTE